MTTLMSFGEKGVTPMKISELIAMLNHVMEINGDMGVALAVDGKIYTELDFNCPDSESPLYIEGYCN